MALAERMDLLSAPTLAKNTHCFLRWELNILDSSNNTLQAFNTTCHYYGDTAYYFAMDDYPVDQPCNNPNVTFSLYPTGTWFQLNVTHLWGNCGTRYLFSLPPFLSSPSPFPNPSTIPPRNPPI